jgi:hypothetical protein
VPVAANKEAACVDIPAFSSHHVAVFGMLLLQSHQKHVLRSNSTPSAMPNQAETAENAG